MSAYLQRLLDRAAGAALDAAPAGPLAISSSPIVGFDQRLADPELASDFTLLGASPEVEASEADDDAGPVPAAAERSRPATAATPATAASAAPASPPHREGGEAKPKGQASDPVDRPLDERRSSRHPASPAPIEPTRQPAMEPVASPLPLPVADARPIAPHPVAGTRSGGDLERPRAEALAPAPLQLEPREPVRGMAAPLPERPDRLADADPGAPPAMPSPAPRPAAPLPVPVIPAPAAPASLRAEQAAPAAVEPIHAAPQPLPVAPAALQADDVARIVRDILRADRAAEPPAPAPQQPRGGERTVDATLARETSRPATADEASVIGKLESSRYRPMLFGVRRR